MANVYATKSGNWSDTTVWNTGGALPTTADDVFANGFTVTIDVNATVLTIRNTSLASPVIVAGGTFVPANQTILTCTATTGVVASSTCYACSLTTGQTCTLNANIAGGSAAGGAVRNNGGGTLLVNGNSIGSSTFNNSSGIINSSTGTITITGNATGGVAGSNTVGLNNAGIENVTGGTINLIGNCFGGNSGAWRAPGIFNLGLGAVNIAGVVQGVFIPYGVNNASLGTINVVGSVLGTVNDSRSGGILNESAGAVNIIGNCTAPGLGPSVVNSTAGTINITGNCTTTGSNVAVVNNGAGILNHVGIAQASVSSSAIGSGSNTQVTVLTGPFLCASNGVQACVAQRWRLNAATTSTYLEVQTNNLAIKRNLYTAESVGGNPAESDVRKNVLYGPSNQLAGTCTIPPTETVQIGVPVDDTFGTRQPTIDGADVWNSPVPNPVVPGSVWEKILSLATTASVGDQIAAMKQASD
jgi:hypothetical protein